MAFWWCWGRFNWCSVRLQGGGGGICGVLWHFDVCILGGFGGVRVVLGMFSWWCWGRFGGVGGVLGVLGRFMGCLGVLGAFWDITIHVRCLMKYQ